MDINKFEADMEDSCYEAIKSKLGSGSQELEWFDELLGEVHHLRSERKAHKIKLEVDSGIF